MPAGISERATLTSASIAVFVGGDDARIEVGDVGIQVQLKIYAIAVTVAVGFYNRFIINQKNGTTHGSSLLISNSEEVRSKL